MIVGLVVFGAIPPGSGPHWKMAAHSPSSQELRLLSARLEEAGETNTASKLAAIKTALETRNGETLTRLLNQRCVQLRAIGMAKEGKLDFHGLPKYKR
jgi:hypothetical protein